MCKVWPVVANLQNLFTNPALLLSSVGILIISELSFHVPANNFNILLYSHSLVSIPFQQRTTQRFHFTLPTKHQTSADEDYIAFTS